MSKKKLIPELRFPEFEGTGFWDGRSIAKNIDLISGIALKSEELTDDKLGTPILRGINITEGKIRHSDDMDKFYQGDTSEIEKYLVKENDIVIGMDGSKVGKNVALIDAADTGSILIQRVARIRAINSDIKYLYQHFVSNWFRSYVDIVNTSSGIPHISAKQIKDFEIGFPPSIQEQKKIASCLSSLDELIAAHTEKLDALKEHKKGLMQNLFPQEGQTVPNYRFSEFENDGEWSERGIQNLIDDKVITSHLDGNHGALYPKAEEFSTEGVPYITANDFVSGIINFSNCKHLPLNRAKKFKKGVAKNGDILFAHNATVGPVAKLVTDLPFVILSTTATYFRCDNKRLINNFLKYVLSSPRFINQYTKVMSQSTRNQVPITTQRKFYLQIPEAKEQQKIASCLSAVDELISAQSKKINELKEHKKGLMQGLFPRIEN